MIDPYTGVAPGGGMPEYYNPYTSFDPSRISMQQAQQAGQAGVPGKDSAAPTSPGAQGQAGRRPQGTNKVRIMSPWGDVREVPAEHAAHYMAKGGRVV